MRMPSLLRYFAVVGSTLFGLIWIVNYFADEPRPVQRAEAPKIVVQHDPAASLIERWRDDQTAMKAAERAVVPQTVTPPPAPAIEPTPAAAEPPQNVAPASLTTTAAAAEVQPAPPKRAKAERPRRTQVARERVKPPLPILAQEQADAARQDQYYYAQSRQAYQQTYQPRPAFGLFGQTW